MSSAPSRRHEAVSLETSGSFPTLEVLAPKAVLSALMVLSGWPAGEAFRHLSNSETETASTRMTQEADDITAQDCG